MPNPFDVHHTNTYPTQSINQSINPFFSSHIVIIVISYRHHDSRWSSSMFSCSPISSLFIARRVSARPSHEWPSFDHDYCPTYHCLHYHHITTFSTQILRLFAYVLITKVEHWQNTWEAVWKMGNLLFWGWPGGLWFPLILVVFFYIFRF